MSQSAITLNPDPPQHGKDCVVGYDGPKPVTLRIVQEPPGGDGVLVTLTTANPTYTVAVADSTEALSIFDTTGDAPDRDVPVT